MWSGIFAGQPTAPKKIASCWPICSFQSSGIMRSVLGVIVVRGEIEIVLAQLEAEFLGRGLQHAHALRHDFLADAVARDDGDAIDAVGGHERFSPICGVDVSAVEGKEEWPKADVATAVQGLRSEL